MKDKALKNLLCLVHQVFWIKNQRINQVIFQRPYYQSHEHKVCNVMLLRVSFLFLLKSNLMFKKQKSRRCQQIGSYSARHSTSLTVHYKFDVTYTFDVTFTFALNSHNPLFSFKFLKKIIKVIFVKRLVHGTKILCRFIQKNLPVINHKHKSITSWTVFEHRQVSINFYLTIYDNNKMDWILE